MKDLKIELFEIAAAEERSYRHTLELLKEFGILAEYVDYLNRNGNNADDINCAKARKEV